MLANCRQARSDVKNAIDALVKNFQIKYLHSHASPRLESTELYVLIFEVNDKSSTRVTELNFFF